MFKNMLYKAMAIAAWITGLLIIMVGAVIGLLIHVSRLGYQWYSITAIALVCGMLLIIISTKVYLKYQGELELLSIEADINLELSDFYLELKSDGTSKPAPYN
jgi:Kef-type K+ transport system membrane component KefB